MWGWQLLLLPWTLGQSQVLGEGTGGLALQSLSMKVAVPMTACGREGLLYLHPAPGGPLHHDYIQSLPVNPREKPNIGYKLSMTGTKITGSACLVCLPFASLPACLRVHPPSSSVVIYFATILAARGGGRKPVSCTGHSGARLQVEQLAWLPSTLSQGTALVGCPSLSAL